jgi:hypothetical protein
MALMLRQNSVLTGAIALAETLRVNAGLRELGLGGLGQNSICNDGAAAIAEALSCKEMLERLDLGATVSLTRGPWLFSIH